jgi:Putative prokaryotic signal transducing protein
MNFIHLRSFNNYVNANIQLGMLQEEGINCHLQDEYTITIDPLLSVAIGGMKLMVFETQVPRAMKLLEAADQNETNSGNLLPDSSDCLSAQELEAHPTGGLLQKLNDVLSKYFVQK